MADEKNNIFDLANELGYQSPFGDWLKTDFKSKATSYIPVRIGDVVVKPYDPYENNRGTQILLPGYSGSNIVSSDNDSVKASFKVIVYTSTKAKNVDITLKGGATQRATVSWSSPFQYESVFEVTIFKSKAYKDGYNTMNFTFTAKVIDIALEQVTDTKIVSVTVDTGGKLSNFRFVSQTETIEFHVYSNGTIEKWVPKDYDLETQKGKIKYVYHDSSGTAFEIAEVDFHYTQKRKNGSKQSSIPTDYISTYDYPKGGNAQKAYLYENGDIYADGTEYGIRKYPQDKGFVQLIRMPDDRNIKETNFSIIYKFSGSQRRYCNPESFAGFIGALADISVAVSCTGMCFADATSYPSVTHPNGDSADTAYFSTLEKEQKKVNAFHKFHFKNIYRGNKDWYPDLEHTTYSSGHNDHLHAGDFDSSVVKLKVV